MVKSRKDNALFTRWQVLKSYFSEVLLEHISSPYNPELYVSLSRGKLQLSTANAIYSFEDLYDNFRLAFKHIDWQKWQGKNVLVLGLGLGSIPQMLEENFKQAFNYTVVEIDEAVIYLAEKYILHKLLAPMEVICADAALFCEQTTDKFDLITIDVFDDDKIPESIEDLSFLEHLKRLLNPKGIIMYNRLARTNFDKADSALFLEGAFKHVFPEAVSLPVKGNLMLFNNDKAFREEV